MRHDDRAPALAGLPDDRPDEVAKGFAIELGVPVVLGPIVGGESWPTEPARLASLLCGLALTVGGAVMLMRSRSIVAVMEAEHAAAAA